MTEPGNLWSPTERSSIPSPSEVVKSYEVYLEVCQPGSRKTFADRYRADPDAGAAEAVVFSWLRLNRLSPSAAAPGVSGPDFHCQDRDGNPVLFEVSVLDREAVTQRSGLPDRFEDGAGSFSQVTQNLSNKARSKSAQLAGQQAPRVLVLCSFHAAASALLGGTATRWLLAEPKISVPIGVPNAKPSQVTDLKRSAFFTIADGAVVTRNKSISAILLVAVDEEGISIFGLLHPEPAVAFDYHVLPGVPFLRAQWPLKGAFLRAEWVIGSPGPARYFHASIESTDEELRGSTPRGRS